MSSIGTNGLISPCQLGNALGSILLADEIVPGSAPSYQLCKDIYTHHVLGAKVVEQPIKLAQSQPRLVTIENAPDEVKAAFEAARTELRADYFIRGAAYAARIYGVGTLACGSMGEDPGTPISLEKISKGEIYFVVFDALNTAGSIVLDQNPNSEFFQKVRGVAVSGTPWHQSRVCVMFNEIPVYLSYTSSAYGFSGRSVYQRVLFPLQSFIRTMITDDMVSQKAGLLVIFMKGAGSVVNALQQSAGAIKRWLLKIATTGEVLQVGHEDRIESVDLQNIDKAQTTARGNIIKNIATGVPMPAMILEQESFAEGFGEGTEDTKNLIRFAQEMREELQPLYDFTDAICMRRAWTPEFCDALRTKYSQVYSGKSDDEMFYSFKNNYKATWPSLLEEPESEKAKQDKAKLDGILGIYQALSPKANEDGQQALVDFMAGNINSWRNLFEVPLSIDPADFCEQPEINQLEAEAELAPKPVAGKPKLAAAK